MLNIEYVGKKPTRKEAGIVWIGAGDVQPVPDDVAARLLKHPDVWVLAKETAKEPISISLADVKLELKPAEDLATLDKAALHALAKERGIQVHHKASAEKVLEALKAA